MARAFLAVAVLLPAVAQAQLGAARPVSVAEAVTYLRETAALPMDRLMDGSYRPDQLVELAYAIRLAGERVREWHLRYPSPAGEFWKNGTMANMEQTAFMLAGAGRLERGCLEHQRVTYEALTALKGGPLEIRKIVIGAGLEHHAVVVFPRDADWRETGVVLDGWRKQSSAPQEMTQAFPDWQASFTLLRFKRARLED